MDAGLALGLIYVLAVIGMFLYLMYVAFVREPAKTVAEFRRAPVWSLCVWVGVLGLLVFLGWIVSFGRFSFDIPTPWGVIKSQWAGGLLSLLTMIAFFSSKGPR